MGRPWHNEDQVYFISSKRQEAQFMLGAWRGSKMPWSLLGQTPSPTPHVSCLRAQQ